MSLNRITEAQSRILQLESPEIELESSYGSKLIHSFYGSILGHTLQMYALIPTRREG